MSTKLELIESGPAFFEKQVQLIESCQRELHFQTFRLAPDSTGLATVQALKSAAARGVKVYVLLDAYGSSNFSKKMVQEIEAAGIHFNFFSPVFSFKNLYFGRRLHHKVLVADGQQALIGGINTADRYAGVGEPAWLDFAVLLEGPICEEAVQICQRLFGRKFSMRRILQQSVKKPLSGSANAQILHNDWARRTRQIHHAYLREIRSAKHEVFLVASYFMPGRRFRKALSMAAKRGVKISLVLPGLSDVPYMKYGMTYLYDLMFKNKFEIREWDCSILHAKVMCVDGKWCTIGSFNLMHLSIYGSVETNVEISDPAFVQGFKKRLKEITEQCSLIGPEDHLRRKSWWKSVRNRFFYYFVRRVFAMMTVFSNRNQKRKVPLD